MPLLTETELREQLQHLQGWSIVVSESEHASVLQKEYSFKDFAEAMHFGNQIAEIAEKENHHPDLHISWGKIKVELSTHSLGGISDSDIVLAEKIDEINHPML